MLRSQKAYRVSHYAPQTTLLAESDRQCATKWWWRSEAFFNPWGNSGVWWLFRLRPQCALRITLLVFVTLFA